MKRGNAYSAHTLHVIPSWLTSGAFGAGPVHGGASVGLGPVDGSPPGRLAETPGSGRQLWDGGLRCAGATRILKWVSAIPGVCCCYSGVNLSFHCRCSSGGDHWGGLGYRWWDGEVFNSWHWSKRRVKLLELESINVLALNSHHSCQWGNVNCPPVCRFAQSYCCP